LELDEELLELEEELELDEELLELEEELEPQDELELCCALLELELELELELLDEEGMACEVEGSTYKWLAGKGLPGCVAIIGKLGAMHFRVKEFPRGFASPCLLISGKLGSSPGRQTTGFVMAGLRFVNIVRLAVRCTA